MHIAAFRSLSPSTANTNTKLFVGYPNGGVKGFETLLYARIPSSSPSPRFPVPQVTSPWWIVVMKN